MKIKTVIKTGLLLSLFLFGSKSLIAQTVIVSENFKNGIPKDWEVTTDNSYRTWKAKHYKNDFYINMSAFGGKNKSPVHVNASLFTPLVSDTLRGCKLKFSFADAYSNGQPLSVYITDAHKNLIKKVNSEYFKNFINNPGKYDNIYEQTPWIDLPALNVPYKIEFKYSSQNKISTTIQLNEVDIWCE